MSRFDRYLLQRPTGKARKFVAASNTYANCGAAPSLQITRWTVTAWAIPGAAAAVTNFSKSSGGDFRNIHLQIFGGKIRAIFTSAGTFKIAQGATTINNGTRYHFGGTYDGTTLIVYVNGVSDGTLSTSSTPDTTPGAFLIGATNTTPAEPSEGIVTDVAVWNVALSATEIASINAGRRPYKIRPQALAGYWPLDGSGGPGIEFDYSRFGNHGALIAGTTFQATPNVVLQSRMRDWKWRPRVGVAAAGGTFQAAWAIPSNFIGSGGYAT